MDLTSLKRICEKAEVDLIPHETPEGRHAAILHHGNAVLVFSAMFDALFEICINEESDDFWDDFQDDFREVGVDAYRVCFPTVVWTDGLN